MQRSQPGTFQGCSLTALAVLCCLAVGVSAGRPVDKSQFVRRSRQTTGVQTVANDFLQLSVYGETGTSLNNQEGRFRLMTTGGDPRVATDDNLDLMFTGYTSYTTIRLETDKTGASVQAGTEDFVFNARPLTSSTGVVSATMPVDVSASNGLGGGAGQTTDLLFRQSLTLARHALEIRYEITNVSTVTHRVGLRIMIDTYLGVNDGAGFLLPVVGRITNEKEYLSPDVPKEWIATDNFNSPTVVSQGILQGSEATPPDRIVFANWQVINGQTFDYTVDPTRDLITDSAVALYWNVQSLPPGQTRTVVTYYGLGYASAEFTPPFVLATDSPFTLKYQKVDDPATPATEANLSPDPFTINAHLFNRGPRQIGGATVSLQLPEGLTLAANESQVKSLGNIEPLAEGSASWKVRATGSVAGSITYTVTGGGIAAPAKSVSRSINVPHLPFGFSLQPETRMISFPFSFTNPDPVQALGIEASEFQLARWDPVRQEYDFYPTSLSATQLKPGFAYWVQAAAVKPVSLQGADVLDVQEYAVELREGWNQIGNPFPIGMYLGSMKVLVNNQRIDWDTAIKKGYLRGTLFRWDPVRREYRYYYNEDYVLQPMDGFWLRAQQDILLVMPAAQIVGAIRSPRPDPTAGGWRLQLVASGGGYRDSSNYLGVSPTASDGFRAREDVEEPPLFTPYLSLHFVHDDWGKTGRNFAQDFRSAAAGPRVWNVEVTTDLPGQEISLSWPNMARVPRSVRFTLTDLATNRSVYLRTSGCYRFRSERGTTVRRFRLTATTEGKAALTISNLRVLPGRAPGSQIFTFSLSQPAAVQLLVRSAGGRVVAAMPATATRAAGVNMLEWNGRSGAGRLLPRGVYIAEVIARAENDQTVRALAPLEIR